MTIENTQKQDLTDEYLIALKRAQAELFGLVKQAREMREAASSTEKEIQRKVRLARSIIESLPKETMKKQFEEVSRLISLLSNDGRTSSTFDLVRKHIAEKKHGHIQSAELVNAPEFQSLGADPKAVYNTLNYLANRGQLRRVSRGRYLITGIGAGVESSVVLSQPEEDSRD
jgi:hypothetical protein